jgi:hypothetical protein
MVVIVIDFKNFMDYSICTVLLYLKIFEIALKSKQFGKQGTMKSTSGGRRRRRLLCVLIRTSFLSPTFCELLADHLGP